jgi:hypothetical protein
MPIVPNVVIGVIGLFLAAVCAFGWLRTHQLLAERSRRLEAREHSSALIAEERRILEMAAQGASLKRVLDGVDKGDRAHCPRLLLYSSLIRRRRTGPSGGLGGGLPAEYMEAVDGLEIGPDVGSRGSAVFRNQLCFAIRR